MKAEKARKARELVEIVEDVDDPIAETTVSDEEHSNTNIHSLDFKFCAIKQSLNLKRAISPSTKSNSFKSVSSACSSRNPKLHSKNDSNPLMRKTGLLKPNNDLMMQRKSSHQSI